VGGTLLLGAVDTSPPIDKEISSVAVMPFGGFEFLVAYAIEESTNNWAGYIKVIDKDLNVRNYLRINGTNIRRIHDIQLIPAKCKSEIIF
jgi:hypothetical protein